MLKQTPKFTFSSFPSQFITFCPFSPHPICCPFPVSLTLNKNLLSPQWVCPVKLPKGQQPLLSLTFRVTPASKTSLSTGCFCPLQEVMGDSVRGGLCLPIV